MKNFMANLMHIEFDKSGYGISYAICSRTAKIVSIRICRGVVADRFSSAISIDFSKMINWVFKMKCAMKLWDDFNAHPILS